MYGKQGIVKRIMLNDAQVIPLRDYFPDLAKPTRQEIDLFNMLYSVDIEPALNDYNQCSSLLQEDS